HRGQLGRADAGVRLAGAVHRPGALSPDGHLELGGVGAGRVRRPRALVPLRDDRTADPPGLPRVRAVEPGAAADAAAAGGRAAAVRAAEARRPGVRSRGGGGSGGGARPGGGRRRPYPRELALTRRGGGEATRNDRRDLTGVRWDDPRTWLVAALRADGRNPAEADALVPSGAVSRRSQVTADLAVLDAAQRIYRRLLAAGRDELQVDAARLAMAKGLVHVAAGDLRGAAGAYDESIGIYRRLVEREGRAELANELAGALLNKGT